MPAPSITPLDLPGVCLVSPATFTDGRGSFTETWNAESFAAAGIERTFCQDNLSMSLNPGTLRGLHIQLAPHGQSKLVQVLTGEILDVVIDARPGSATLGQHVTVVLREGETRQLFVPDGYLHGFVTRQPHTRVAYKVDAHHAPAAERSVRWDDLDLAIDWQLGAAGVSEPILSSKDGNGMSFADLVAELSS